MKHLLRSKKFHSFLGFLVSALLLAWILQSIDLAVVMEQLADASLLPVIFAIPVIITHFLLRALRWKYLLVGGDQVSLRGRFDAIMIGCLANFLLPLRAGEFVRPLVLARKEQVTFMQGFTSVITERFFDLAAVLLTFSCIVTSSSDFPNWVGAGAYALGVVAGLIFLYIILAGQFPQQILRFSEYLLSFFPAPLERGLKKLTVDLIDSARVLRRPRNMLMVLLYTVFIWITSYLLFYVFLYSLPIPRSPLFATTIGVIVALAVAAPSAPGFLGVYQTACYAAFSLYGVNKEYAISFSVLSHLFQYVFFIAYGFYALWLSKMRLGELYKSGEDRVEGAVT